MKTDPPRVLLAGAAGFVGSFLAQKLVSVGAKIIAVDNLNWGIPSAAEFLQSLENCDFFEHDITQPLPASFYPKKQKFTHLVHAANVEAFLGSERVELDELLVNSYGIKNLLDLAHQHRARLVITSAIEIYRGLASSRSLKHYYDGVERSGVLSFLEAKRYAEALCQQYVDLYDLDVRVARFPEVYGPRMNLQRNGLLAHLIQLALAKEDLAVNEEGSREHILLYVEDAAEALIKLLLLNDTELKQSIFSFVNPEKVSTLSLAYVLREVSGFPLEIKFEPPTVHSLNPSYPLSSIRKGADWNRAQKMLRWQPQVDLAQGLEETLEYFRQTKPNIPAAASTAQFKTADLAERIKLSSTTSVFTQPRQSGNLTSEWPRLTLGWQNLRQKLSQINQYISTPKARKRKEVLPGQVVWASLVLSFFLILPPTLVGAFGYLAINQARNSWRALFQDEQTKALRQIETAQNYLELTRWFLSLSQPGFWLTGQSKLNSSLERFIQAAYFSLEAERALLTEPDFLAQLKSLARFNLNASSLPEDYTVLSDQSAFDQSLSAILPEVAQNLQLAQATLCAEEETPSICQENLFADWPELGGLRQQAQQGAVLLLAAAELTNQAQHLALQWKEILGYDKEKAYLILLQNNTELRATGGFIGSFALLKVKNGGFFNLQIDDIYNPEGQLQQKIPAPEPVKKYMDVTELGIRDANWWPHFPESAQRLATLFQFAGSQKANFVVALNLTLVENILKITGPVWLDVYQEEVSAQNLFERAEIHAEVAFKPGSSQKKDFLGNLAQELIQKLLSLDAAERTQLLWVLAHQLSSGEALFFAQDEKIQASLAQAGWAGELKQASGDYLAIYDSNMGGNKANFWINRSLAYEISVSRQGDLTGHLQVTWQHQGLSHTWPGGDYQNYLRVYLPLGSQLVTEQNFADTPQVYEEFGKTVIGGLVKVPINSTKVVSLSYHLPKNLNLLQKENYSLYLQKQSGTQNNQFNFRLNLPPFLRSEQGSLIEKQVLLDQDWRLALPLTPAT